MLSTYDTPLQLTTSNSELAVLAGPHAEAQTTAHHLPIFIPANTMTEKGSQDMAAFKFFSELMNGHEFVNPTLLHLEDVITLPPQELRSARLPPSPCPTIDASSDFNHETQTMELHRTVLDQQGQIEELQRQITRSDQRCTYYREKAATFKALYSQQRGLAEQIMASLVHIRLNTRKQEIASRQTTPSSS
ncbi:hypothetical protein BKA70DRAFT_1447116 [Coprinopsis sp. MPI-PUGE-AT-0042]|nr:hypothetical protein BKA70DRAFT_1447116 [Coprinopsis sp. MPI-PUGE-AT-0042]